jgi:transposase-like protein
LAFLAKDAAKPHTQTMQIICRISHDIQYYRENHRDLIDRPLSCPQPDCRCRKSLNHHGIYPRGLIIDLLARSNCCYLSSPLIVEDEIIDKSIPILRFLCKKCGRTVSFLPAFAIPFKHYSSDSICACLHEIYQLQHPINQISEDERAIPVRTIMEWKKQWQINTPLLFQSIPDVFGQRSLNTTNYDRHDRFVFMAMATSAFPAGIPEDREQYCKSFASIQPGVREGRTSSFKFSD